MVSSKHYAPIKSSFPKVHRLIFKMKWGIWCFHVLKYFVVVLLRNCSQGSEMLCVQICIQPIMKIILYWRANSKRQQEATEKRRTREQENSGMILISISAFYSHPRKGHSSNT